jgi:transposase InsO family protein
MSGTRRGFPESFKREAVNPVVTSGLSAGKVAAELGLHETVLRRWMMQFGFVDEHRSVWPVRVMCAVLGLSASGYYAWRTQRPRDQARRDLFQYIEGIYNPRCLHSALGYISPAEMEHRAAQPRPLFPGKITGSMIFTSAWDNSLRGQESQGGSAR